MYETHTMTLGYLRARDTDYTGRWRPGAIFLAAQEAAGEHSELLGCGYWKLFDKHAAWILVRTQLEMSVYPRIGETVNVRTWPGTQKRWFFPRYYVFETPSGERLGAASSLWALLDLKERTMLSPANLDFTMPDTSALTPPLPLPEVPDRLACAPIELLREPVYSDIDINGHVNNTRYIDWLFDAIGTEELRHAAPATLRMAYHAEVRSGAPVHLQLAREGDAFSLAGLQGDTLRFEASGTLMRA